ncbi:hypothetical protein Agub_g2337 [Astrephomene gubernaculifera]|uniref:1,4-dihydroxy-2-naphthoate octaprenyltransferase n=1 Tax=Astrephomene gubernaculifera TaxID=47775 RepID=A0AAD3DIZ3_9CHLO|nr:hypothetical protein Agub_g2337 [Astrephomene gubernaculifera]
MSGLSQILAGSHCVPHMNLQYAAQHSPAALMLQRKAKCSRLSARPIPQLARMSPRVFSTSSLTVEIQPNMSGTAEEQTVPAEQAATAEVLAPASLVQTVDAPAIDSHTAPQQPQAAAAPQQDRKKLWMAAIKPPMYSVGFIPVLVASAAVFLTHGVLPWGRTAGFVLAAIFVIAWLNLSNDAFDAQTGVDVTKPESVVNLLGGPSRRTAVLLLAKTFLAAGVALLGHLITSAPGGDLRPMCLLAFSIACGYVYQGPPFRLSYKGLGEPLCFVAFGPSATTAFYLALQPTATTAVTAAATAAVTAPAAGLGPALSSLFIGVPAAVWACSLLVGLSTTTILFCSHFHQIAGDTAAGKRSPLVRLGTERGRKVLRGAVLATHGLAVLAAAAGVLPWVAAAATVLAGPAAAELVAFADANHTVPERIAPLKRFACKWHILLGFSLCVGMGVSRALGL